MQPEVIFQTIQYDVIRDYTDTGYVSGIRTQDMDTIFGKGPKYEVQVQVDNVDLMGLRIAQSGHSSTIQT